ncbi:Uncharacterized membrane protein [Pseudonocardia ammonioxydans]|uniref:Uncharacterized membrane protein n=2 Tax=Pseudonocardia ammonioxydans TaxID=260086 RepID=A0A1I4T6U5_PSUAM|nr:Uncharacterized membrane protein [Pseudonocardia ammonioxydans]
MTGGRGTGVGDDGSEDIGAMGTSTDETVRIEDPVTTDYLAGLRTALGDLPSSELEEIVEDTRGHLADLDGELGEGYDRAAVHERLGAPEGYAAELRAAAGFPAPPAAPPRGRFPWAAWFAVLMLVPATLLAGVSGLAGPDAAALLGIALVVAGVGALPVLGQGPRLAPVGALGPVAGLRDRLSRRATVGPGAPSDGAVTPDGASRAPGIVAFVAGLQPGWWVLRAIAAAGVGVVLLGFDDGSAGLLAGVLLAVVAVPLSVALGYRARADRRRLWLVVPLNAFAAGLLIAAAETMLEPDPPVTGSPIGLAQDGEPVTEVRPFDAAGRPLSGVHLFDQDGQPLTVYEFACTDENGVNVLGEDQAGPFPRDTRTVDPETGRCTTTPPEPMVVTVPGAAPTPATSVGAPPPATTAPRPGG